MLIMIPRSGH